MRLEKETALYDPNAITKEVSNFTNEIVEINGGLQQLEQQIDGQVVTWFYNYTPTLNNLPASGWDSDEKELHLGDIFYNTTTYLAYVWSKSGSTYSWNRISDKDLTTALQKANNALDTADKKRRVFISTSSQQTPTPPYDYGDIWFQGSYYDKDILTCVYADGRPEGVSFVRNDWAKLNKYTDDSALTTFLNGTYYSDKTNLQSQIDKKAETWYQSGDPSTAWTTEALKAEHEGDLWYKTTNQTSYRYSKINNIYSWQQENVPTEVFDKIDGKSAVYTSQPSPPYNVGDLWFNSTSSDILTCMQSRTSGQYISSDWVKRNKYTDDSYARTLASKIGDTPDYFWFEGSASSEFKGAHITQIPEADFRTNPSGGNFWATSDEISLRESTAKLGIFSANSFSTNAITNYDEFIKDPDNNPPSIDQTFEVKSLENPEFRSSFTVDDSELTVWGGDVVSTYGTINPSYDNSSTAVLGDYVLTKIILTLNIKIANKYNIRRTIQIPVTRFNQSIDISPNSSTHPLFLSVSRIDTSTLHILLSSEMGAALYATVSFIETTAYYNVIGYSASTHIGPLPGSPSDDLIECTDPAQNVVFSINQKGEARIDQLYLNDSAEPVGTLKTYSISSSDEFTVYTNNTWTSYRESMSFPISWGVWLVTMSIHFTSSGNGYTGIRIGRYNASSDTWSSYTASNSMEYNNSKNSWLSTSVALFTYDRTVKTEIFPVIYNTGVDRYAYGSIRAVKLI